MLFTVFVNATFARLAWLPLLLIVPMACSSAEDEVQSTHENEGQSESELVGTVASAVQPNDPISQAIAEGSCSTSSVRGLSEQLVDEIQCMKPGQMKRIDNIPGIALNKGGARWLQTPAADALIAAQKARGGTITINSALRTLPDQYVLYRWFKQGKCGITAAATPGNSNHESGIAIDVNESALWRSTLQTKSFKWLGPGDVPHYDFTGPGTVKLSGLSLLAFQRLWNRNHPDDKIPEDMGYGAQTEQRLLKAPVGGFPIGAPKECPPSDMNMPDGGMSPMPGTETPNPGESTPSTATPDANEGNADDGEDVEDAIPPQSSGCNVHGSPAKSGVPFAALAIGALAMAAAFVRRRSSR